MSRRVRANERLRVPAPLIRTRLPSGRGATEQPNVTGDGDTPLTLVFWVAVVFTGVATGLVAIGLMWLLFGVQHLAFNYHSGELQSAVERASSLRRVSSLLIAGLFGGIAWYLLRRYTPNERAEIDNALWTDDETLSIRRSAITSVISEVVIGMGASIGREAAPKLMGGVSGSVFSGVFRLSSSQRRLLMACGAGAGLAAVYNVPLGGALFTAEILIGQMTLPVVLPALACSSIATAVGWLYLPNHATYIGVPTYATSAQLFVWSLIAGPLIGLLAAMYIRMIGVVAHHRASGRTVLFAPLLAFGTLGLLGLQYPQLFGNGKDMARSVFLGGGSIALLFALFALKPLVTALCLGSGATGGLFTPFLSTGAVLGGFLGLVWDHLWPGAPLGAFAMVGAAAMIGASMQAPLVGLVLVVELTHSGFQLIVPMILATVLATAVARHIDGYSIYTARLPETATSQRT